SSDDCVHGCLSDLTVFGGRNEPARQMNRNPPKNASQLEDPTRQSERWFNSATYAAAEFVIGRLQRLLFVVGFTYCVIFATLQNLFFTAMVQGDFFGWMSRIYYRWGVAS